MSGGSYQFGSKKELIQTITIDPKGVVRISGNKVDIAKKGEQGLKGDPGRKGDIAKHEWEGTKIRFQNPDKTWGQWVDLKGVDGRDGQNGEPGKDGENGKTPQKGFDYFDGQNGQDGKPGRDGVSLRGEPGRDGENGRDGEKGGPGVEPEEMENIRMEMRLTGEWVKKAMEKLADMRGRLENVKDGKDGKDGRNGNDGQSVQGAPGPQGDKGEPGIPPHDWNITLDKVARMEAALKQILPPEITI